MLSNAKLDPSIVANVTKKSWPQRKLTHDLFSL